METFEVFCFGNTLIADEGSPLSAYLKSQKGKRIRITIPQIDLLSGGKPTAQAKAAKIDFAPEPDGKPFIDFNENNPVPF